MRREMRLKHISRIAVSNVDKKSVDDERPVRLCNYTDVYYNDRITQSLEFMSATASDSQLRDFRLCPGDVLITKDSETPDDIAVPALVKESADDLVCGYHLALIRPDERLVDPRFLFWALASTSARSWFGAHATGVTRFGLRAQVIADARLSLPSLAKQREIANFLDAETARIDALITTKVHLAALARERFAGWRETKLTQAPSVTWTPLQHLTDPYRPIVYGIVQPGEEIPDGVPYIKSGDLRNLRSDQLSRTSHEIHRAYRRAEVRPGDIVIAMRASIGEAVVVPAGLPVANLTQGTARVAASRGVSARWLFQALRCRSVQEQCVTRAVGTTYMTLNIWDLRRIMIPTPPREVQELLADTLDQAEARMKQLRVRLRRQIDLLAEHRQALITAVVTGQLEGAKAAA